MSLVLALLFYTTCVAGESETNKPLRLPDGSLLCPSRTEDDGWKVHLERTRDLGQTWGKIGPLNEGQQIATIQPSLLVHPGGKLQALGSTRQGKLFSVWSVDGGQHWGKMTLLEVPNPNSGTDAVTLTDGRHLLVYTPTKPLLGKMGRPAHAVGSGAIERWPSRATSLDAGGSAGGVFLSRGDSNRR